jgi:hypothetical protein
MKPFPLAKRVSSIDDHNKAPARPEVLPAFSPIPVEKPKVNKYKSDS